MSENRAILIQAVTGLTGAGILWWKVGFWVVLAVFLILWGEHCWVRLTLKLKGDM